MTTPIEPDASDASEKPEAPAAAPPPALDRPPVERRPWLERIGLAAIAVVMGALFALVAVAAGAGGEWILAAMSAVGAFMTIAVGLSTLIRG
jgi:hypothetical protein